MKLTLLATFLAFAATASAQELPAAVKPQTRASAFTYPAGSTAAYTPQTGLIYSAGTYVKHPAGTTILYPSSVVVSFPYDSQFYVAQGPVSVVAGTNITFGANAQVTFPPGTALNYLSNNAEAKYQQFNGNTHTIAQYTNQTMAQFYCSNCNLFLHQAGTNPLVYYNPGGSTAYGSSALPVEKDYQPTARTYGGSYGGGGGYNYCSGYSYQGYPQTTYYNYNTGYRSTCQQTGYNTYTYGGGSSGGGGGGYSMAGGSCYGGGAYYGSSGGYYG